jgi:hypothetical protein
MIFIHTLTILNLLERVYLVRSICPISAHTHPILVICADFFKIRLENIQNYKKFCIPILQI